MKDFSELHLGKQTEYVSTYDPELLTPIPRSLGRGQLDIFWCWYCRLWGRTCGRLMNCPGWTQWASRKWPLGNSLSPPTVPHW